MCTPDLIPRCNHVKTPRAMSPLQQLVVDREKDEAERQSKNHGAGYWPEVCSGGRPWRLPRSHHAGRAQENLEDQMDDIQTAGSQRAFDAATSLFNTYQQARQAAGQMEDCAQQQEQAGRIAEEQARRAAHQMNLGQAQTAAQLGQSAILSYWEATSNVWRQRDSLVALSSSVKPWRWSDFAPCRQQVRSARNCASVVWILAIPTSCGNRRSRKSNCRSTVQCFRVYRLRRGRCASLRNPPTMTQQLLGSGIAGVGLLQRIWGLVNEHSATRRRRQGTAR